MSVTTDKRGPSPLDEPMGARKLLDYTVEITSNPRIFRPDINKDLKEVKSQLELSPTGDKATVNLVMDTLLKLSNPVEDNFLGIINKVRDCASEIFLNSGKAGKAIEEPNSNRTKCIEYILLAKENTFDMKAYISLVARKCHLKDKRVTFWNSQVNLVQQELNNGLNKIDS